MRGRALLFGLNYAHCKQGQLNGCINDVRQMAAHIYATFGAQFLINIHTDDVDKRSTSYNGIIQKLYDLAIASYKDNLEFVWIHYSGHGSYQADKNSDESDGKDEGLVPSDYEKRGILLDDFICKILEQFNPKTKIFFVTDCCHSGSILDLKYSWNEKKEWLVDNKNCNITAPIILISGCLDSQTSADAYNLLKDGKHIGALTASILKVLDRNPRYLYNVFTFVDAVRQDLKNGGFEQYPCISSTYDLIRNPSLITYEIPQQMPNMYQQRSQMQAQLPQQYYQQPTYYEAPNTYMISNQTAHYPLYQYVPHMPQFEQFIVTCIPIVNINTGYGMCI
jgi:hypothetical protein